MGKDWQRQNDENCWSIETWQEWGLGHNIAISWCSVCCCKKPSQTQLGHIWKHILPFKRISLVYFQVIFPYHWDKSILAWISLFLYGDAEFCQKGWVGALCCGFPTGLGCAAGCAVLLSVCTALLPVHVSCIPPSQSCTCSWGLQGSDAQDPCSRGTCRNEGQDCTHCLISSAPSLSYCF